MESKFELAERKGLEGRQSVSGFQNSKTLSARSCEDKDKDAASIERIASDLI
jgi:hypothetical protein